MAKSSTSSLAIELDTCCTAFDLEMTWQAHDDVESGYASNRATKA